MYEEQQAEHEQQQEDEQQQQEDQQQLIKDANKHLQRLILLRVKEKDDDDDNICTICQQDIIYLKNNRNVNMIVTPCNHHFHYTCFRTLIKHNIQTCPVCRHNLQPALQEVKLIKDEPVPSINLVRFFVVSEEELTLNELSFLLRLFHNHGDMLPI